MKTPFFQPQRLNQTFELLTPSGAQKHQALQKPIYKTSYFNPLQNKVCKIKEKYTEYNLFQSSKYSSSRLADKNFYRQDH